MAHPLPIIYCQIWGKEDYSLLLQPKHNIMQLQPQSLKSSTAPQFYSPCVRPSPMLSVHVAITKH